MCTLRPTSLIALLAAILFGISAPDLLPAQTNKVACTPCEDYYGMGNFPPGLLYSIIPTGTPGMFSFYHIDDPDTNVTLYDADWIFTHDTTFFTVGSGDTVTYQFPGNGVWEVLLQADYLTPSGGCMRTAWIYVTVNDMPVVTAAPEPTAEPELLASAIFPNPSRGQLTVRITEKLPQDALLQVIAMDGRVLRQQPWKSGVLALDITDLSAGMYAIRVDKHVWRVRKD